MLEILQDSGTRDGESHGATVAGIEGNFAWMMGGDPTLVPDTDNDATTAFITHLNDSLRGLAAIADDEVDLRQMLSEAVVQATCDVRQHHRRPRETQHVVWVTRLGTRRGLGGLRRRGRRG